MLGTYLYFKCFSVRGKLKRIHKSMLKNSDMKTLSERVLYYIILYIKVQMSPHIAYIYYTIQRPIAEEKLIVYSSLLVAII
jgi:hypothetical protein